MHKRPTGYEPIELLTAPLRNRQNNSVRGLNVFKQSNREQVFKESIRIKELNWKDITSYNGGIFFLLQFLYRHDMS